jgi:beta-xylosidase
VNPNPGIWPLNFSREQQEREYAATMKDWSEEWVAAVRDGLFVKRDFSKGQMARDMALFLDDDGKAYHIHASEENLTLHIAELNDDFTGFTGKYVRVMPGGHNEAPALFKKEGKYYMVTSGCTGWAPNAARSAVATHIFGPWEELGNPCSGEGAQLTFNSQSTFILPVPGDDNQWIFMADRWNPKNPIDGRYVWLPLVLENGKPVIRWKDDWQMDSPE